MDHFQPENGVLHCEAVPLPEIAAAVGTPVYVYSTGRPWSAMPKCCGGRSSRCRTR